MIKVLVVEDSPVQQQLLTHILSSDPGIEVIGVVESGEDSLKFLAHTKPDIIIMDIFLPKMNGYTATRIIMEKCPVPIIIVSSSFDPADVKKAFLALDAGALTAMGKPVGLDHPDYHKRSNELIQTTKLMSEVKVVRRWARSKAKNTKPLKFPRVGAKPTPDDIKLVVFGASTGGPTVLRTILSELPKDFPVPLLIIQHISRGFLEGFREWLGNAAGIMVHIAQNREILLPSHAYLAPESVHLRMNSNCLIELSNGVPEHGMCPSVSYTFRSVADVCGKRAIGVLLTGIGKDGAKELKLMRERGAITIAQDMDSSTIHGMPGEAIKLGAAIHVLPPLRIAKTLVRLLYKGKELKT